MSDDAVFRVSDYYELLALHRTVMEAKFHPDPDNRYVAGSPFVARMSERIVAGLIELERRRGRGERAEQWAEWRSRPQAGRCWEVAVKHAMAHPGWVGWSPSEKLEFAVDVLAPFAVEAPELAAFVGEVDRALAESSASLEPEDGAP